MLKVASAVRGIRNANPGNIRRDKTRWKGMRQVQTDPNFCQFISMEWGVRACAVVLATYRDKHNLVTVRGIINRWAPPVENDTLSYAKAVAARMGVGVDTPIHTEIDAWMFDLIRGIIRHEVGAVAALLVSDATVREGIELARST